MHFYQGMVLERSGDGVWWYGGNLYKKKREKEERESAKAWLAMHGRHDQKVMQFAQIDNAWGLGGRVKDG
jgi:hypothetical protein